MARDISRDDVSALIGSRVRELRTIAKVSQEELAFRAGLDRTYINSIENGRRNVTLRSLAKIAAALEITLSDFF